MTQAAKSGTTPMDGFRPTIPASVPAQPVASNLSNDVTIRHFTTAQTRPQRNVKLMNIGDDVTVRYFSGESAVTSQAAPFSTTPTTK